MKGSTMAPIVTVLKSGGIYSPKHVEELARQILCFTPSAKIKVLTDIDHDWPLGIQPILLTRNWPGWWSKIELFLNFDEALYFDLDTVVVRDISRLFVGPRSKGFWGLRDVLADYPSKKLGSGIMAWRGDYTHIPLAFSKDYKSLMLAHKNGGDQAFIETFVRDEFTAFQDIHPGFIVSFKRHVQTNGGFVPASAGVVCYHGRPKPWEPAGAIKG
jgi:alpha-N-acetylglucosamine transferase